MSGLEGRTFGKYQLIERLGRGGMADVYKAFQPGLDRYVAIKVLHEHLGEDDDFIVRFKREAKSVADLRHSHIVQVFDFDIQDNRYFMAMEYIEGGETLKERVQQLTDASERMSVEGVLRLGVRLADALAYAHNQGMVHRDIKPANVLLRDGEPVLGDFGIARMLGQSGLTASGAMIGTPVYMSPEQGRGEMADERSDIYALGIILYELLIGAPPYDADTPYGVILKHINDPIVPPSKQVEGVPDNVERLILKCLAKDPDDRFQTAGDLKHALEAALADPGELATQVSQPTRSDVTMQAAPPPPAETSASALKTEHMPARAPDTSQEKQGVLRRVPWWGWAVAAVVLLALLGGAWIMWQGGPAMLLETRAMRKYNNGDIAGAQQDFEQAYEMTGDTWYLEYAAFMALRHGDIDGAFTYYEQLLVDTAEDPQILADQGFIAWFAGDHDRAQRIAERALAVDPQSAKAHYLSGLLLLDAGRPDQALEHFAFVAEVEDVWEYNEPFYVTDLGREIHFDMARAARATGDGDYALELSTIAVEEEGWWPHPYILRAEIHAERGENQAARDNLLQALEIAEDQYPDMADEIRRRLEQLGG